MRKLRFLLAAVVLIAIAACKKDLQVPEEPAKAPPAPQKQVDDNFFVKDRRTPDFPTGGNRSNSGRETTGSASGQSTGEYEDEVPMILGPQLNNPYSIPNMTAAYNVLYGTNFSDVATTHLYVKFMPTTEAQFAFLEDSLELDVYDHPLDHELIQDGDYYVEPGRSIEDMPNLYTVVEPNFQFPAGIPYTILAQLHIPPNDNLLLEEFAESMAEGAVYYRVPKPIRRDEGGRRIRDSVTILRTDIAGGSNLMLPPECFFEDPNNVILLPPDCYNWNPPPPPPPPPSTSCGLPTLTCTDNKRPAGRIRVWDTQLNQCVPVVDVKVVAKRWFKSSNTYTNAQGQFSVGKRFNNKVKVKVHFRNAKVSIRPMRHNIGIRLSLFTIKHRVGVFQHCAMNTVDQIYYRHTSRTSRAFMYWLAAHGINARNYQWQQAVADEIKPFTGHRLVMYLMRGGRENALAPEAEVFMQSYLYKTKPPGEWIMDGFKLAYYALKSVTSGGAPQVVAQAVIQLLKMVLGGQQPDIIYRYNTPWENLSSSEVNQQFYAAYSNCGLLKATSSYGMGDKWKYYFKTKAKWIDVAIGGVQIGLGLWYDLIKKKFSSGPSIAMMVQTLLMTLASSLNEPEKAFYDQAKGFGEFYGHYLADRQYGALADGVKDQANQTINSASGLSSHKIYLENWNPNFNEDLDIGYKTGLFYDLDDNTTGEQIPTTAVFDLVSSIKPKDFEKSFLGASPATVAAPELWQHTRSNLILRFPLQQTSLNSLFGAYNVQ